MAAIFRLSYEKRSIFKQFQAKAAAKMAIVKS